MSVLMKDSCVEWIGDIPNDWNIDRFKDIAILRNEKIKENSTKQDYVELEDIEQSTGKLLSVRTTEKVESAVTKFYKDDVLFGKLRPYLEKYNLASFDGKCTGEILAFKPQRIEPKFLFYNVASHWFINVVNAMSYGVKMPRVNWSKQIALLDIPLPPKTQQKQIADFLDKATLQIDDAIKTKEKQLKTLEALKKSIIHKAVTKGLDDSVEMIDSKIEWIGDIPKSWRVEKLKYIGKSIIGLTYSPNDVTDKENGIHVLRSSNIQNGKMDFGNNVYVDKKIPENLITQKGDILICSRNGSRKLIGKNILIDESNCNCTFGAFMTIFRSNMNKYLYFIFNSTLFSHQAGSFMTSTINQLTINAINNMKVPIPPKDEQKNIIDYLTIEVEKINTLKENVKKQIDKLKEYKKSLIYEYVTGKKQIKG